MKSFKWVVREIRWTIAQVLILPSLLKGIVFFLALYLALTILDLYAMWAIIPTLFYTAIIIGREVGTNKLRLVEKYYPSLREKLRTAADYAGQDDVLVNELHKEVIEDVKKVAASTFFSSSDMFYKILSCILLSFLIVGVTHFNITASVYTSNVEGVLAKFANKVLIREGDPNVLRFNDSVLGGEPIGGEGTGEGGAGERVNRNIFGDEHLATLGEEELEVEIKPTTLELRVGEVKDPEDRDFEEVFPGDIYLEQSRTFEENIPKEQQEIVKAYFKRISAN